MAPVPRISREEYARRFREVDKAATAHPEHCQACADRLKAARAIADADSEGVQS